MSRLPGSAAISRTSHQRVGPVPVSHPELPELVRWIARRVKVLELGCGDGAHALWFAEQGYHATALVSSLQRSRELRREAEARAVNLQVVQHDFGDARLAGKYDIVVAQLGVPEISVGELIELIRRMQAHTRRGGYNLVSLAVGSSSAAPPSALEGGSLEQEVCALYADWRLLSRRSYLSAEDLPYRADVIRLIAQRRA